MNWLQRAVWVLSAATLLAAPACFLPSFEESPSGSSGSGQGGQGGTSGDTCSARWALPVTGKSEPTDAVELRFALRTVLFGDDDPVSAPGFDLDRTCTCCTSCPEVATCALPSGAKKICDAGNGRDNAIAHMFGDLLAAPANSSDLQAEVNAGNWGVLVRVTGYNGQPDDDSVTLALYTTNGTVTMPLWDGTDEWPVRSDSLTPGGTTLDEPSVFSTDAYVSGGVLVAPFGDSNPFSLTLQQGFKMNLSYGLFSARVVETAPDSYRLAEGTLGGIWSMTDAFVALGIPLSSGAPFVCMGTPAYGLVKSTLCGYRDSHTSIDVAAPCNAISFGMAFDAEPVVFGAIEQLVPPPPGQECAAGLNPAGDSCE